MGGIEIFFSQLICPESVLSGPVEESHASFDLGTLSFWLVSHATSVLDIFSIGQMLITYMIHHGCIFDFQCDCCNFVELLPAEGVFWSCGHGTAPRGCSER